MDGVGVLVRDRALGQAQFVAHPPVPELGQRLGELDRQAVDLEVIAVVVRREQLVGEVRDRGPHGDELEGQDVDGSLGLATLLGGQEIRDAQEPSPLLAGEGDPVQHLRVRTRLGQHTDVLAVGVGREVPVDHSGVGQDSLGGKTVDP